MFWQQRANGTRRNQRPIGKARYSSVLELDGKCRLATTSMQRESTSCGGMAAAILGWWGTAARRLSTKALLEDEPGTGYSSVG